MVLNACFLWSSVISYARLEPHANGANIPFIPVNSKKDPPVTLFSTKVYAGDCHWLRFFAGVDSLDMLGNTAWRFRGCHPWKREQDLGPVHMEVRDPERWGNSTSCGKEILVLTCNPRDTGWGPIAKCNHLVAEHAQKQRIIVCSDKAAFLFNVVVADKT